MQNMTQAMETHEHMRTSDRLLSLKLIDDKAPMSSTGLIDRRLFTGDNKLHAVTDAQTGMWSLRYEQGKLPQAFQCSFTSFKALMKFASAYFLKRNVMVEEVTT
jgi:hypothetical protein